MIHKDIVCQVWCGLLRFLTWTTLYSGILTVCQAFMMTSVDVAHWLKSPWVLIGGLPWARLLTLNCSVIYFKLLIRASAKWLNLEKDIKHNFCHIVYIFLGTAVLAFKVFIQFIMYIGWYWGGLSGSFCGFGNRSIWSDPFFFAADRCSVGRFSSKASGQCAHLRGCLHGSVSWN